MSDSTEIDRIQAETRKLRAEAEKLDAENKKLAAEQQKLFYEALKFEREHKWYPWLQILTVVLSSAVIAGAVGAIVAKLLH